MSNAGDTSPSILIADDDPLVCHLIRLHLERTGYENLTVVHDGQDAVRYVVSNRPDLLLLDITMPDMDGFEVLSTVKSTSPETQVIMLTGQAKVDFVTQSIAAGANGYLVKRVADLGTLSEAVRLVVDGDAMIIDQELLQEAAKHLGSNQMRMDPQEEYSDITQNLTSQELNVLKLIAGGLTNHEIGEALNISYNTVKSHVSSIYQKLKVSDRTQAAIVALRQGITPEDQNQEHD